MRGRAFCLAVGVVSSLVAGGWAPIPPAVWALKEDPAKGLKGAVVLEDRMVFNGSYVEYTYRVRIFSEAGKDAADMASFSEACYDFDGRTVYPDGRVVAFSRAKDFQAKSAVKGGHFEAKRTKVVPPGVTGDCVVELKWRESAGYESGSPLPTRMGHMVEINLANAYPTQVSAVEIPRSFSYAFQVRSTKTHSPQFEEKGGYRIYTFRDLPAMESVPYSLAVTADVPKAVFFLQPDDLAGHTGGAPDAYWKRAIQAFYKPYFFSDVSQGKAFKGLAAELLAGLPEDPQAAASELFTRMHARIRSTSQLTFEELAARPSDKRRVNRRRLEEVVKEGETDSTGMGILFLHLLKARGIDPKIALVADRDLRLFSYKFPNVYQFTDQLFGVEVPGKAVLWFDPGLRFSAPGFIHPDYQGTQGLEIDTKTWTCAPLTIPAQPALFNATRMDYVLDLQEDEDLFKLKGTFNGAAEQQQRSAYMSLESKEQNRLLKEAFEGRLKQATFTRAEVLNANNPKENTSIQVEGRIEREAGRRRVVDPFPGMNAPLWIPDDLAETRKEPIVMSYLRVHVATSTFAMPKGYTLGKLEPWQKENSYGMVRWIPVVTEKDGATQVKLVLRVDVNAFFSPAETYGEFKEFLGWIREACGRTLILEKR